MHVADGVDMHHQRHAGHHHQHHRGQRVNEEADGELETTDRQPSVYRGIEYLGAAVKEALQYANRENRRNCHAKNGNNVCSTATNRPSKQACNDRPHQW
ncbi:hypothetical protein D3C78_1454750 [compost metagenome]